MTYDRIAGLECLIHVGCISCAEIRLLLQDDGALTTRLTDGEAVEMDFHNSFDPRAFAATG